MQSLVLATQEASTTDSIQRLVTARNRGRGRGKTRCGAARPAQREPTGPCGNSASRAERMLQAQEDEALRTS